MNNWKTIPSQIHKFLVLVSKGNKRITAILIGSAISSSIIPFLSLYFSAEIINALIQKDFAMGVKNVSCMLILQLIFGLIAKACTQQINLLKENCRQEIDRRVAEKTYHIEYEDLERQETLDTIRRARNCANGDGGIDEQIRQVHDIFCKLSSFLLAVSFVIRLLLKGSATESNFFTSPISGVVLLLIYALILVVVTLESKKIGTVFQDMLNKNDHVNSVFGYLASNIYNQKNASDVRVYQIQEMIVSQVKKMCIKMESIYAPTGKKHGVLLARIEILNQIAAVFAYIFIGGKAYYGAIGVGDVLLYVGAINLAMQTLTEFIQHLWGFLRRQEYLSTIDEFINRPIMHYDGTLPVEKRDDARYEFEFHDVSFSYPDTTEKVLSHVNLKFNIGERMALVGRNGAGKTTIIKLLCRLYDPTEGMITLNGVDIRYYDFEEYTSLFSVVFQDFHLFSMPLDENVASGEKIDKEQLCNALKKVDLLDRVMKMPEKLHAQLYHNNGDGVEVSGGEAQRLAIARALYKDGAFVILDEPTAALDPIAEAEIYENFNEMIQNKTAIYISHRMSSCKFCNRIVVLDQGEIAESGSHEELIEKGAIYATLYNTQAQYYGKI